METHHVPEITIIRDNGDNEEREYARIEPTLSPLHNLQPHTFRYRAVHSSSVVVANRLLLQNLTVKRSSVCYARPVIRGLSTAAATRHRGEIATSEKKPTPQS